MKHKFSFGLRFNAWLCIAAGVVLFVLILTNNAYANSGFVISAFYCATALFITDYVIQILFDCRIFLKQIASKTGSNNNFKSDSDRISAIEEVASDSNKSESIWAMKIGNGSWFMLYFIALLFLLAIIIIVTAR